MILHIDYKITTLVRAPFIHIFVIACRLSVEGVGIADKYYGARIVLAIQAKSLCLRAQEVLAYLCRPNARKNYTECHH